MKPKYEVTLESKGNPDHNELFGSGVLSPTIERGCFCVQDCQIAVRDYVSTHNLGGGNWTGGEVKMNGKVIGRISFNGSFWSTDAAFSHGSC